MATVLTETKEGYQVYPKGGRWVIKDPYTGNLLGKPFVMAPDGFTYAKPTEQCVSCWPGYEPEWVPSFGGKFCKAELDCLHGFRCENIKCDRSDMPIGFVCKFDTKLKLNLKGLCKETKVDTEYLMLGYEVLEKGGGNKRKFGGSTGCWSMTRSWTSGDSTTSTTPTST